MMRNCMYAFISLPVFAVLYVLTFFAVILTLLFAYLNLKSAAHGVIRIWAKTAFWSCGKKLHIIGKNNIEQGRKYILLANHSSLFDIMAIMSVFPEVSWFGRERLLKIPLFGHVLKMTDYVPMRTTDIKNTKNMISQLIDKSDGSSVAIFPEGTRTKDGKLGRFRKGFIYLLRAGKLDVLPVTLRGLYDFKPKTRFRINFSARLEVCIHRPLRNSELLKKSDKEILKTVKDIIASA